MQRLNEKLHELRPALDEAVTWSGYVDCQLTAAVALLDSELAPERVIDALVAARSAAGIVAAKLAECEERAQRAAQSTEQASTLVPTGGES